jgi:hypothetical protein
MAGKYHVKPDGTVAICKALKGKCPYGGQDQHYPSKEIAARAAQEKMNAEHSFATRIKANKSADFNDMAHQQMLVGTKNLEKSLPPSMQYKSWNLRKEHDCATLSWVTQDKFSDEDKEKFKEQANEVAKRIFENHSDVREVKFEVGNRDQSGEPKDSKNSPWVKWSVGRKDEAGNYVKQRGENWNIRGGKGGSHGRRMDPGVTYNYMMDLGNGEAAYFAQKAGLKTAELTSEQQNSMIDKMREKRQQWEEKVKSGEIEPVKIPINKVEKIL